MSSALRRGRRIETAVFAAIAVSWAVLWLAQPPHDLAGRALHALAMTFAVMVPLAVPGIGYVIKNSLRRRRRIALLTFLAAFVAPWLMVDLILGEVGHAAASAMPSPAIALAVGTLPAVVWHGTTWKRAALRDCRRSLPLPPDGWRASLASATFGASVARRCVVSCWPAMLIVATAGAMHALVATLIAAMLVAEQTSPVVSRSRWIVPTAAGSIAAVAALTATVIPAASTADVIAWLCRIPGR